MSDSDEVQAKTDKVNRIKFFAVTFAGYLSAALLGMAAYGGIIPAIPAIIGGALSVATSTYLQMKISPQSRPDLPEATLVDMDKTCSPELPAPALSPEWVKKLSQWEKLRAQQSATPTEIRVR